MRTEEAHYILGQDELREAESELVRCLELDLDNANDRIDQLEWRLEQC